MKYIFVLFGIFNAFYALAQPLASARIPGTLDSTFSTNGKFTLPNIGNGIYDAAVQADDKILQTGVHSKLNSSDRNGVMLIRYEKDGGLDTKFGDSGIAITDLPDYYTETAYKVIALRDGHILVMIAMRPLLNYYYSCVGVLRYKSDGTLDSSFGVNGLAVTEFSNGNTRTELFTTNMVLQDDGKILISGYYHPNWEGNDGDIFIIRYTQDGKPDESFGINGIDWLNLAVVEYAKDMQLKADGKIMLATLTVNAAYSINNYLLVRLSPDGSFDNTFGTNGIVDPDTSYPKPAYTIDHLAIRDDGKMVSAGVAACDIFGLSCKKLIVAGYNEDGSIDENFGDKGKTTLQIQGRTFAPNDILLQNNGKILVAGDGSDAAGTSSEDFFIVRYNISGTLDSSFGENGITTTDFSDITGSTSYDIAQSVCLQSNGEIIAAGTSEHPFPKPKQFFSLARYYGDPLQQSWITKIKRWIRNHILHFQDLQANNTAYYAIEKSNNNNSSFKEVARIEKSEVGNQTSEMHRYVLPSTVNSQQSTESFYRIKAIGKDGSVAYSDVISETDNNSSAFNMFPNPVKDVLHVTGLSATNKTTLTISNVQGNIMKGASVQAGSYNFNVSQLKQGTYYLQVKTDGKPDTYKFIKE